MKDIEELLNEMYPDRTNNNMLSGSVIQKVQVDFADNLAPVPSTNNMQYAEGNAQVRDFFTIVGDICKSAMEDMNVEYMPYEVANVIYKSDSDNRLEHPVITYRVLDRRHSDDSSYKPMVTSDIADNDNKRTITRSTERFDSTVQFTFMSTNYEEAYDVMDMFEEIMINYAGFIRKKGILVYYFLNQNGDISESPFRETLIVFTLNYKVKTEKNRVITKESIKSVNVQGTATTPKGEPLL